MKKNPITAVVLAAGKGTRMKSDHPKVLHEVLFSPMIHHVMDALLPLDLDQLIAVTGFQYEQVEKSLARYPVVCVRQERQMGTGHAVLVTEGFVKTPGTILILCGDTPLVRPKTLSGMLERHQQLSSRLTVMTTRINDPAGYGRIIADSQDHVLKIVEERDADRQQKGIKEINCGIYCVEAAFLFEALKRIKPNNDQKEIYLTDIVGLASNSGLQVGKYECAEADEALGVNSRAELAMAHEILRKRRNMELMVAGVTLVEPDMVTIAKDVRIGQDTLIHPHVQVSGDTVIGRNCRIESFVVIRDCRIGDDATIGSFSCLHGVVVGDREKMVPATIAEGSPE